MSIRDNLTRLLKEIPQGVKLVVVSKTKSVAEIMEAYDAGQRMFGENKAQEVMSKKMLLPGDIEWHFIGHLQTNKVRQISSFIHWVHSIDSLKLLVEVNRQAMKNKRIIHCLLQMYIATEETKFGLDLNETKDILESPGFRGMENIRIDGLMGMATFTCDKAVIRKEFRILRNYFNRLKSDYFQETPSFSEISMGMSSDYQMAIEEGSTMVRIGTAIFGSRS
ncbi:MAG: YggS family pyridoxal phosphate-dependent enzyme [Bacteroidetes bacterium]|nr:YggS family pyridoxal phosphate-dependent enzyme [Bacteroidota bacterium]